MTAARALCPVASVELGEAEIGAFRAQHACTRYTPLHSMVPECGAFPSRLPGLRLADDDGFDLRVGGGCIEPNLDDDPLKAVHARVFVTCSERSRALKHL